MLLRPSTGAVLSLSKGSGHIPAAEGIHMCPELVEGLSTIAAYCAYGANGVRCFTKWSAMMR